MRFNGHNILAIILAALAIYAIEFVIFAVIIPGPTYENMVGLSASQMTDGAARMPYGAIMPLLAAIGLSLAVKWRGAVGLAQGFVTGAIIAICFGFAATMYQFVYGAATPLWLPVSLAHFVVAYGVAGAILSAWK